MKNIGKYLMSKVNRRIHSHPNRFSYTDLTADYLESLFYDQDGKDFYTGLPFSDLRSVSVDRIDSEVGYVRDNVVLTHKSINIMKNRYSLIDFIKICNLVSNRFPYFHGKSLFLN